jgi:hypothetical protein
MNALACVWGVLLLASPAPVPRPSLSAPVPSPSAQERVILFLIDNSASLPPLDPQEKRVVALEKMFTFLKGQPYRLVLFGGRHEISVDDVSRYNNRGQWTDFYFAFDKAKELIKSYPPKTEFRMVLLTDGLLDPLATDWDDMGMPPGANLKEYVGGRTVELLSELKVPLYTILVGDIPPREETAKGSPEQAPPVVMEMARAANGVRSSSMAQSLAGFFKDDGLLLKKFVFRVSPQEGLKTIVPVIQRITAPPRPSVEFRFLTFLVLPLFLVLFLLLGLLVRSFPGPGDLEIVELTKGSAVHLAADKMHKLDKGGWGAMGLSLVADAKEAAATLTYQAPPLDLTGIGVEASEPDSPTQRLMPLPLDELKKALEALAESGSKEEKIYSLNLDYMAKNLEPAEVERILAGPLADRRRTGALDFLRAKVHLLSNDELRRRLTDPRVHMVTYGKQGARKDLLPGAPAHIGRYGFLVKDVGRGGRRDVRLVLYYDRVPSLLGLKTILPDAFQRFFRFRRSSQRIVS